MTNPVIQTASKLAVCSAAMVAGLAVSIVVTAAMPAALPPASAATSIVIEN